MNEYEIQVQKNIINFTKILPAHVELWRSLLKEAVKSVEGLVNQAEQLRHVERANITCIDSFESSQDKLQFLILSGIEEQIGALKITIEKINKANQDLRNKLVILEKSTLALDWELNSPVIIGNGCQPSLYNLLQNSLRFWTFLSTALRNINETFKLMDVRNEKSMKYLELSFQVDLENKNVSYLLALTQYVNNETLLK